MVDTIELRTDTIGKCRFAQIRRKGGQAKRLPPCNYGKGDWMLEELGLIDPRLRPSAQSSWDGLERIFA